MIRQNTKEAALLALLSEKAGLSTANDLSFDKKS